jgi:flagella basal body P-ring formation protein FlgA
VPFACRIVGTDVPVAIRPSCCCADGTELACDSGMMNDLILTRFSDGFALATVATACLLPAPAARAEASPNADLARAIEVRTGEAVSIDPRLPVPSCRTGFSIDWLDDRRTAVAAGCAAPAWRLVVPLVSSAASPEAPARSAVLVRRGEAVRVRHQGPGFEVQAVLQATSAARAGERLTLRNTSGGRAVIARVGADGGIELGR